MMKLIIILLTAGFIQVKANGFAQEITLRQRNINLDQFFTEIRKQTGYHVVLPAKDLRADQLIAVDFKNTPLEKALNTVLNERNLTYTIRYNTIVITEKEKSILDRIASLVISSERSDEKSEGAQDVLRGRVLSEDNKPLAGATVTVRQKGTDNSIYRIVVTDRDGRFILRNVPDGASLSISYVGYETLGVNATDDLSSIRLTPSASNLDEVVVNKGYYNTTKEFNTGDISTVTSEEIGMQPVGNALAALQGRIPGLLVSQNSGIPGQNFSVQLRGRNSIANGNDPLYIIDGVPFTPVNNNSIQVTGLSPFNGINSLDIERIDILKDADATAIYGSRGANGVILITTKKGTVSTTKVDVNVYSGIGKITGTIDLLNTPEYLQMRREAIQNDGLSPDPRKDYDLLSWDTNSYTDWQKLLIGNTAHYTDAQASASGGNTNTQFLLGAGFHKETTVFTGNSYDQKGTVHFNLNNTSRNQKFKLNLSSFYTVNDNYLPGASMARFITLPPDAPAIYNADGSLNWANSTWTNPFSYLEISNKTTSNTLNSNLTLAYELLPGLTIKTSLGYNNIQTNNIVKTPQSSFNPASVSQSTAVYGALSNGTWIAEPQINYIANIGTGRLEVLLGTTFSEQIQNILIQQGTGYSNDALLDNRQAANTLQTTSSVYSQYRYSAAFGRIGYNLLERYIINLTARRDGSSRFGPGKQFGNFGSVGAAWIFSKESFFSHSNIFKFLSVGKLRASYGTSGNDQIGDYNYLDTYETGIYPYQGVATLSPQRLANSDYAWEYNKKMELGSELGFLQNDLQVSASYYRNRSSNQLLRYALPRQTGFGDIAKNLPATVQNSGWEFTANSTNIKSRNWSWSTSLVLTMPQSKLLSFPSIETSAYSNTYVVGEPLSTAFLYNYTGIDPASGLYTFTDYDKNGQITSTGDQKFNLKTGVQYYGGLGNAIQYKGLQIDFFFQFSRQKNAPNYLRLYPALPGSISNQPDYVLDRWTGGQTTTDVQKFSNSSAASAAYQQIQFSNLAYSDASYLRLKTLSVSYQLPAQFKQSLHLSNARVYLQGQNLLTFTNYFGLDPETFDQLPPIKVITAGIQLTL